MNTVEIIINLVSAIAVVLSVVFLAFQIKKNTNAVKANFYDSLNHTNIEFLKQLVEHERLGKLLEEGAESWDSMQIDDKRTANILFIQLYRHWENMFYQNKMKVFEGWLWESHKNTMISYFHKQGIKEWWRHRKHSFSKEYGQFLENSKRPSNMYQTVEELTRQSSKQTTHTGKDSSVK